MCQVLVREFLQVTAGDVAQLVEHLLCKQGVGGSSPLVSTNETTGRWPNLRT